MEYSKDIILGIKYLNKEDKCTRKKLNKLLCTGNKHKFIIAILVACTVLIILDFSLVYNFMKLLQTI